jgi:hypothetical protein
MKIKRRKKNDRAAFYWMPYDEYGKYRLAINPERRTDKTMAPATLRERDRARAKFIERKFKSRYRFVGTLADVLGAPSDHRRIGEPLTSFTRLDP